VNYTGSRRHRAAALLCALPLIAACGAPEVRPIASEPAARPAPGQVAAPPVQRAEKPNVLMVMTDDMRYDELRYLPHVRQFIEDRGTDFTNSFAPTPLCCPNRASFLTGELPHNHGVWWHDEPWGYGSFDDSRTLAGALQDAGYSTGYVGKYLNRYGIAAPKAAPGAAPSTYVPAGWDEWRATPDAVPVPSWDPLAGSTYDYFDTTVNVNGTLEPHQGEYNSQVLVNEAIKVLDKFTAGAGEAGGEHGDRRHKPWFIQINSLAPHHGAPFESDDPFLETPARPAWVKDHFDAEIPQAPGIPPNGVSPEADVSDKAEITSRRRDPGPGARRAVRETARQRAESLFALDRHLARLFRDLKASGEYDDTVVVFTSDNGYLLGEHRWLSGKVIGFEPSYRVPLLIAGPGVPVGERVNPVTTVDLTASILDWAGAHLRKADGISFVDDLQVPSGWTRAIGYESYLPSIANLHDVRGFDGPQTAIGIRTAQYFYVKYSSGEVELFDLERDPLEMESRADDPAYADVRRALNAAWRKFRDCAGADCDIPLPPSLSVNEDRATELRAHLQKSTRQFYGG
jgi:arylsulfatase A-like enzyme